jgi:hypothetical protein
MPVGRRGTTATAGLEALDGRAAGRVPPPAVCGPPRPAARSAVRAAPIGAVVNPASGVGKLGLGGVAEVLAADLRAATANLSAWIEARAAELAAAQVAEARAIADARCAAYEQAFAVERRRHGDLEAELRRQLDGKVRWQEQHVRGRCVPAPGPAG